MRPSGVVRQLWKFATIRCISGFLRIGFSGVGAGTHRASPRSAPAPVTDAWALDLVEGISLWSWDHRQNVQETTKGRNRRCMSPRSRTWVETHRDPHGLLRSVDFHQGPIRGTMGISADFHQGRRPWEFRDPTFSAARRNIPERTG